MIMKKKNPIPFYVIIEDVNAKKFVRYDVMDYFIHCYEDTKKNERPTTFKEFKEFVERKGQYMYWGRCQYEIVLRPLIGNSTSSEKIDVWWQLEMNIDLVVHLLMHNVGVI